MQDRMKAEGHWHLVVHNVQFVAAYPFAAADEREPAEVVLDWKEAEMVVGQWEELLKEVVELGGIVV